MGIRVSGGDVVVVLLFVVRRSHAIHPSFPPAPRPADTRLLTTPAQDRQSHAHASLAHACSPRKPRAGSHTHIHVHTYIHTYVLFQPRRRRLRRGQLGEAPARPALHVLHQLLRREFPVLCGWAFACVVCVCGHRQTDETEP